MLEKLKGIKRPKWLGTKLLVIVSALLLGFIVINPLFNALDKMQEQRALMVHDVRKLINDGLGATADHAVGQWLHVQWNEDPRTQGRYEYRLYRLDDGTREDTYEYLLKDLKDYLIYWSRDKAVALGQTQQLVLASTAYGRIVRLEAVLEEIKGLGAEFDESLVNLDQARAKYEELEEKLEKLLNE